MNIFAKLFGVSSGTNVVSNEVTIRRREGWEGGWEIICLCTGESDGRYYMHGNRLIGYKALDKHFDTKEEAEIHCDLMNWKYLPLREFKDKYHLGNLYGDEC